MKGRECDEPMCETSETGEKLIASDEILPLSLEIGRRIMELFGFQSISQIVFRLKSNSKEINAIIAGKELPSAEFLIGLQRVTGVSIDWVLSGRGTKFTVPRPIHDHEPLSAPTALRFTNREGERSITRQAA